METLMWAVDLILVAGLCFWAIREDGGAKRDNMRGKKKIAAESGAKPPRNSDHA